jgi:uncharacterized phage-associated protein
MGVLGYDEDVDFYEDDEPLEHLLDLAQQPAELVSVAPLSVLDVARALLEQAGPMDTYKLQKLCYYAQAQHVAFYNTRLFTEPIEAWRNGPVVRELWRRHAGKRSIIGLSEGDASKVQSRPEAADTVRHVLDVYGCWDGQQLSEMTHREQPWRDARAGLGGAQQSRHEIPVEALRDYYRAFDPIEPFDEPGEQ